MVHVWSINSGERFQGYHGPLVHVLSTIIHECPHTISRTEIKAKVIQARGGYEEEDLIGFTIDNPRNNVQLFTRCSAMQFYPFDDDKFRADKPFYIIEEPETYVTSYNFPDFPQK